MKIVFKTLIFVSFCLLQFLILEVVARIVAQNITISKLLMMNPYPSFSDDLKLPDLPSKNSFIIKDTIWVRLAEPSYSDHTVNLKLDNKKTAILVGGSSPHGHKIEYSKTAWGQLDQEKIGGMQFLNSGVPAAPLDTAAAILLSALAHGNIAVAAIFAGDNEWASFKYPRMILKDPFHKLDYWLYQNSVFYKLLAIPLRHWQSDESIEAHPEYNVINWFSYHRGCFDNRYKYGNFFGGKELNTYRQRILDKYSATIDILVSSAQKKGAKTILYTTPIRYRMSPCHGLPQFLSEKFSGSWQEFSIAKILNEGLNQFEKKEFKTALETILRAYNIDPESVITNYYLAQVYEVLGQNQNAFMHYKISRDRKVGKNGLLPSFNEIIKSKNDPQNGVYVIDLDTIFLEHSRKVGKGLNDELIFDWCHQNEAGNFIMASETKKLLKEILQN